MPQRQLPIFPEGASHITKELAVKKEDGKVIYYNGHMPVFIHDEDDLASFRMITSQFYINGNVNQVDIVNTFGVTAGSVKRAVKLYKEKGAKGFFQPRKTRQAQVLTPSVLSKVQMLLDQSRSVSEIAQECGILRDTLKKAIQDGRLHLPFASTDEKKSHPSRR